MREEIKHIVNALKCVCAGNQTATDSLAELQSILTELENIGISIDLTNFELTPGNSKEITYWGAADGTYNPSGNKNIDTIVYKTGVTTVLTQKFTWDLADDLVKIENS